MSSDSRNASFLASSRPGALATRPQPDASANTKAGPDGGSARGALFAIGEFDIPTLPA